MAAVELEYAAARGWRGRWGWRRVGLVLFFVGVAGAGWVWRGEVLRKGRVMWWQREVAGMSAPVGVVVYESRVAEAKQLLAGAGSAYRSEGTGAASWWPGVWRDCPWGDLLPGAAGPPAGMRGWCSRGACGARTGRGVRWWWGWR